MCPLHRSLLNQWCVQSFQTLLDVKIVIWSMKITIFTTYLHADLQDSVTVYVTTPYNKMFATVVERNDGASTSHGYSSHLYWLSWVPIPLGWGWKKKCYTIQVIKPWRMCSNEQILSLPCGAHLDGCLSMRRGYMERSPYWQTENQEISTTSLS